MKNRFSRMGKTLLGAMCLLSLNGVTYSCSDDYDLDETMPGFLGGSIYDELKARNFTTVVQLIDNLGYKEVLAKTGSKTLFVANDEAYKRFFANNTTLLKDDGTPVRKYEELSLAQKRWLLNGAMLNSAYVVEMLAHNGAEKNLCLRQASAATAVDTIRLWKQDELPNNLNVAVKDEDGNKKGDKRFWDYYRNNEDYSKGIYMAIDKTSPMLTHFLEGQMREKKIKDSDVAFILNKDSIISGDAYVYGSRIIRPDVTCLNGYFHELDEVMLTPQNMAEVIRTNGSTNLFSAMLERFSAPYYDYNLTEQYKALHNIEADSIFYKRYISERSIGNAKISLGPDKKSLGDFPYLPYDPGWNELTSSTTEAKEKDMAAMFVPNDEAMADYFLNGGGKVLMDRYATMENTRENLLYNMHQIPLDLIRALLANLMKDSFSSTVPSKYLTIMNDAQDQMFLEFGSEEQYKQCFEKCLLANNGVVYVMNRVMPPADFASVIAPALYQKNTQIVKTVARADDSFIQGSDYDQAPLKKYYSTYLKAMQSHFSFFVPTDDGLSTYGLVDPMSVAKGPAKKDQWKYWKFNYKNAANSKFPLRAQAFKYNVETGQVPETDPIATAGGKAANISEPNQSIDNGAGLVKKFLMIDLMDQHIIVHDSLDVDGMASDRKYYTSRGGAPVIVLDKGDKDKNGVNMIVNGGFQYQLNDAAEGNPQNDHDCVVTEGYNMTNGMTYIIDRPMQATTHSLYHVFNNDDRYSEFFDLAKTEFSSDLLTIIGLKSDPEWKDNDEKWINEQLKYRIFVAEDKNRSTFPAEDELLVRFFNNYRYTVYVPTNEAMQKAYYNGLPNKEFIENWVETHLEEPETEDGEPYMTKENQLKAQAMVTMLVNFVKYHFQDQAFYVDDVTTQPTEYQTSAVDQINKVYLNITMSQSKGKLTVKDEAGHEQSVIKPYNVIARDSNFDKKVSSIATSIENSSYVVVHQVAEPLNFKPLEGGRYDSEWASSAKAKAFLAKYRILK